MGEPAVPVDALAAQVTDGAALARYLRAGGLSCTWVAGPGSLAAWGVIYLRDPADVMRVCVLLDGHPQIVDLAESRDRVAEGWPLWFRVAASALPVRPLPTMGIPTVGKP